MVATDENGDKGNQKSTAEVRASYAWELRQVDDNPSGTAE